MSPGNLQQRSILVSCDDDGAPVCLVYGSGADIEGDGVRLRRYVPGEQVEQALPVARRDWAVRVLDAWQRLNPDAHAFATCYLPDLPIPAWKCVSSSHPGVFFGPDPDAARLAAAEAVLPELPESVRAELGERP